MICCSFSLFAANLRDYVCIVRPNISEKTESFLKDYKDYLLTKGYKSYANNIENYLKGSFGSGFIFYGSDGKPYIVTNRHVVLEADTVNVQFENEDGSVSEYKDLKIVACDEEIDIALVALPENFKKAGLTLSKTKVSDGDDVWSAGFPGLGSDPVWQLGKGIVSNSSARIKELLDPSVSTIIQHSAQVDAGNSGGPLMVVDKSTAAGYSVIGINTWKAAYRENTNFAIPASVIKSFVDKSISKKSSEGINDRLTQFSKAVAKKDATFSDISRYVSNDMVAVCGGDLFIKVLQKASSDVRSVIVDSFAYDPIEGLRYTLAYYIYGSFQKDGVTVDYTVSEPTLSGVAYKVTYSIVDGKEIPAFWIEEQGNWKLSDFDNLASGEKESDNKKEKSKRSAKENYGSSAMVMEDDYDMQINAGYILPKGDMPGGWLFELAYGYQYVALDFFLQSETIPLDISDEWDVFQKTEKTKMNSYGIGLRVQFPFNFAYVIVEPYADARVGFSNFMKISENLDRFYLGYGAGVDVIINGMSDAIAPVIGVKYLHTSYKTNKSDRFAVTAGLKLCTLEF